MKRIRFALRTLGKTPVLALVVVVSLGLGIGANTAIFSLLYQILLRAVPVERPEELVLLTSPGEFKSGRSSTDNSGSMDLIFNYRTFRELEKRGGGVTAVAGFRKIGANVAAGSQTVSAGAMLVSGAYFPMLGVKPLMGRLIGPEDDVHGAGNAVAVLSYGYWKDRLGGRPEVLNQPVRINGQAFTLVGVAARGFMGTTLGMEPGVFVPMSFKPRLTPGWNGTDRPDDYWVYLLARLKPGFTRAQAEAALNGVYAGLVEEQAKTTHFRNPKQAERFTRSRLSLRDGSQGQSSLRDSSRTPLYILMAATALVLLIAMANAANLLLARSAQRRKELAIRAALGAGRGDIMAQMLTEALLLAAGGAAAGLVVAYWTVDLLLAYMSRGEPVHFLSARPDWPVLLFCVGVSLLTGVLFGLHPAWEAARQSVAATLKDDAGQTSAAPGAVRVRKLLVCMQVAISALLLVPTGLFLKSLVNLVNVDLGLRTENVITFGISPDLNGYTPERSRALFERVEAELAAIPGVRSTTSALVPLIAGSNWGNTLTVEGFARGPGSDTNANFNEVGPEFFSKMGIPLVAGREFSERDNPAGPKVAVVSETFAQYFFPKGGALGGRFCPGWGKVTPDIEIVGIVKDAKYSSVKQKPPRVYYVPWRQSKERKSLSFYVRTALEPAQVIPQVRRVMASIDRDLPLENLRTLDEQVADNIRQDRLVLQLAAVFAALATAMAMLGLYGVMAYSVARRKREIGIRLALGAGEGRIRSMVMRELLVILAVGLALGVPASLAVTRLVQSQLFGVQARDGTVIAGAAAALAAAALLAGFFPARRATRVDPAEALRYE